MSHPARSLPRAARSLGLAGVLTLTGLAACGDDSSTPEADATTTAVPAPDATTTTVSPEAATTTAPPDVTTTAAPPAEDGTEVSTAETDLGTILVDADGNTLYVFLPDAQGPATCLEGCSGSWPGLTGPATAGDGVDASLLGTADRPDDGTAQVTYDSWPLYRFVGDTAPGDTNGQGVGDVWFTIGADGQPNEG